MRRFSLKKILMVTTLVNLGIFVVYVCYLPAAKMINQSNSKYRISPPKIKGVYIENTNTSVRYTERHSGQCMNLKRPINVIELYTWQKVGDVDKNYVFSAFFDGVAEPKIRIFGLKERLSQDGLFCQLWYNETEELVVVQIRMKTIPEDHGKRYSAVAFMCSLNSKDRLPYAVSVVTSTCEQPSNLLSIQSDQTKKWQFSLCLTPFNFRYSRAHELIEMIELNRLLGVQHFFFYNYSTGRNVDNVLHDYVADGLVTLIQWHLPVLVSTWPPNRKEEVHYFGQLANLNECLYRNLYSSKYVVFSDLDEFIVPRKVSNFHELMQKLDTNSQDGAFLFRCTFFRKDWPQLTDKFEGRELAMKYRSATLLTVLREKKVWPPHQRSKYIVKPTCVEVVGIHSIWTYRPGYSGYRTDESDAQLHHYRNWENPKDTIPRKADMIIHEKFKAKLLTELELRWQRLPGVPLDIPITNYATPLT